MDMLGSSQHVYSDEIPDFRHTWQLILASCTRATYFDVQQRSSSSHYIEVLSLPMQVFQIMGSCWPQQLGYMSTASVCHFLDIPSKVLPHSQSFHPEKNGCPKNREHSFAYHVRNNYAYIKVFQLMHITDVVSYVGILARIGTCFCKHSPTLCHHGW